jgi:hypothetical protein
MSDDPARGRRRTVTPEPPDPATPAEGQEQLFGDLSGMAREAVRSPPDPRLDAHLRFRGLGDTTEPVPVGPAPVPEVAAAEVPSAERAATPAQVELDQLRATVARLQTATTETADRIRQLTFVIGVLAIATVVALIIGIVR